jgi:hypothetical protein
MINRINRYLITHYPLLWNTRVVWIVLVNLILHVFFAVAGYSSITATEIKEHYGFRNVGGGSMYMFSVLCSILVVLLWLIYYLRNNAYKQFYRISKAYLVKEFFIVLLILMSSITYFESFNSGVKWRLRSITSQEEFINEANAVNQAMAFIPLEKRLYFVLNSCKPRESSRHYDPVDTTSLNLNDPEAYQIRMALRRPDAFSYWHYCEQFFSTSDEELPLKNQVDIVQVNRQWIRSGKKDSISTLLDQFLLVCKKYNIELALDRDTLINRIFSKPYFAITELVPTQHITRDYKGDPVYNKYYIQIAELTSVFNMIESAQATTTQRTNQSALYLVISHVALGLSILLLCYRRFSRKVFLISIVGTVVWMIIISFLMMAARGSQQTFPTICLTLAGLFLLVSLVQLQRRSLKTLTGVTLTWFAFLTPYIALFLLSLADHAYSVRTSAYYNIQNSDEIMKQKYPFLYWVRENAMEISWVNLLLVILFFAFVFNIWAKRWHLSPEE